MYFYFVSYVVENLKPQKLNAPKFVVPIQGSMVEEGQKVVVRGVFESSPEPSVLWLHNQTPIRPGHDVKIEVGNKETSIAFAKVVHKWEKNHICIYTRN